MSGRVPDVDPRELGRLLALRDGAGSLEGRLERISAALVGRPYVEAPLVGSPSTAERLVGRLDGFDCVTFVETVWALATCAGADDYLEALAALRYEGGEIAWMARNHYMTDWLARNERRGAVRRVGAEHWHAEPAPRTLSCLEGYPPRGRRMRYLPLDHLDAVRSEVRSGDVVCFVSVRPDLDTYHVGLLIRGEPLRVRHAARSAARVTDETLEAFLGRNETPGLIIARLRAP